MDFNSILQRVQKTYPPKPLFPATYQKTKPQRRPMEPVESDVRDIYVFRKGSIDSRSTIKDIVDRPIIPKTVAHDLSQVRLHKAHE